MLTAAWGGSVRTSTAAAEEEIHGRRPSIPSSTIRHAATMAPVAVHGRRVSQRRPLSTSAVARRSPDSAPKPLQLMRLHLGIRHPDRCGPGHALAPESCDQRRRGSEAGGRVLRKRPPEHLVVARGKIGRRRAHGRLHRVNHTVEDLADVLAFERLPPREHLIGDDAQREDVGRRRGPAIGHLLGRHEDGDPQRVPDAVIAAARR